MTFRFMMIALTVTVLLFWFGGIIILGNSLGWKTLISSYFLAVILISTLIQISVSIYDSVTTTQGDIKETKNLLFN